MGSTITTLFGVLAAAGTIVKQTVPDPTAIMIGEIMSAVGIAGLGIAARDNNKSSEKVGAK